MKMIKTLLIASTLAALSIPSYARDVGSTPVTCKTSSAQVNGYTVKVSATCRVTIGTLYCGNISSTYPNGAGNITSVRVSGNTCTFTASK